MTFDAATMAAIALLESQGITVNVPRQRDAVGHEPTDAPRASRSSIEDSSDSADPALQGAGADAANRVYSPQEQGYLQHQLTSDRLRPIDLRPAQQTVLASVLASHKRGRNIFLQMPPRTGKTTVAMATLRELHASTKPDETPNFLYLARSWLDAAFAVRSLARVWTTLPDNAIARVGGSQSLLRDLASHPHDPSLRPTITVSTHDSICAPRAKLGTYDAIVLDDIDVLELNQTSQIFQLISDLACKVVCTSAFRPDAVELAPLECEYLDHTSMPLPPYTVHRFQPSEFKNTEQLTESLRQFLEARVARPILFLYNPHEITTAQICDAVDSLGYPRSLVASNLRHSGTTQVALPYDYAQTTNYKTIERIGEVNPSVIIANALGIGGSASISEISEVLLLGNLDDRWLALAAGRVLACAGTHTVRTRRHISTICASDSQQAMADRIAQALRSATLEHQDERHHFQTHRSLPWDAAGGAFQFPPDCTCDPATRGLWTHNGMGFTIEWTVRLSEYEAGDCYRVASKLSRAIASHTNADVFLQTLPHMALPEDSLQANSWNIRQTDTSGAIHLLSPMLSGRAGFLELLKVCYYLAGACHGLGLELGRGKTFRIRMGCPNSDSAIEAIENAIVTSQIAIASILSPHIIFDSQAPTTGDAWDPKNFVHVLADRHSATICLDWHESTFSPDSILLWISLWQQLIWSAGSARTLWLDGTETNIERLVAKTAPDKSRTGHFMSRLHDSRLAMAEAWNRVLPNAERDFVRQSWAEEFPEPQHWEP